MKKFCNTNIIIVDSEGDWHTSLIKIVHKYIKNKSVINSKILMAAGKGYFKVVQFFLSLDLSEKLKKD